MLKAVKNVRRTRHYLFIFLLENDRCYYVVILSEKSKDSVKGFHVQYQFLKSMVI